MALQKWMVELQEIGMKNHLKEKVGGGADCDGEDTFRE